MTVSNTTVDAPATRSNSNRNNNSTVSTMFHPAPRSEWKLLAQGAEAKVWKLMSGNDTTTTTTTEQQQQQWICKERFSKSYRHPDLDERLTKSRCRSEAKNLEKCDKITNPKSNHIRIRVPKVIRVEPPLLYLEYLHGPTVKEYLKRNVTTTASSSSSSSTSEPSSQQPPPPPPSVDVRSIDLDAIAKSMGKVVGNLHTIGLVHGDLTTANMMLLLNTETTSPTTTDSSGNEAAEATDAEKSCPTVPHHQQQQHQQQFELALIDFGLAKSTNSTEEQAVDLYVLERALQSTHPELDDSFFATVLEAYSVTTTLTATTTTSSSSVSGSNSKKTQQTTLQRLEQVRLRGRKRECFG
jgi:TP53 regulating kinase and related kinases